jgi:hypothetical protein
MTEMDAVPEADAVERAAIGDEVPEADAVEQAQVDAADVPPLAMKSIPDDVPEADALEQAFEVPLDDDYR